MLSLVERVLPIASRIKSLKKFDAEVGVNFFLHIAPKSTDIPLWIDKKIIHFIDKLDANLDIEFFDL